MFRLTFYTNNTNLIQFGFQIKLPKALDKVHYSLHHNNQLKECWLALHDQQGNVQFQL